MAQVQQLFVEPADLALPVDEMDFEYPVGGTAGPVGAAHRLVRAGSDEGLDVVASDLFVRELADQVPGYSAAEFPAGLPGQVGHPGEQLLAADIGVRLEELAASVPQLRQRVPQPRLDRIVAENERPAEVGFPLLEDGPEVAEHDVVVADDLIGGVLPVRLACASSSLAARTSSSVIDSLIQEKLAPSRSRLFDRVMDHQRARPPASTNARRLPAGQT